MKDRLEKIKRWIKGLKQPVLKVLFVPVGLVVWALVSLLDFQIKLSHRIDEKKKKKKNSVSGSQITKMYSGWEKCNNRLIIFPMLVIIAYEAKSIRSLVKKIARWLQIIAQKAAHFLDPSKEWFKKGWPEWIAEHHYHIEFICLFLSALGILGALVLFFMTRKNEKETNDSFGDDEFETGLLRYLNKNNSNRCFLLSGNWGVGKTYMLQKVLNKYYSRTGRNIYRISCFGLNNRKDIIDEINKAIGNNDSSALAVMIDLISKIPIIGELTASMLKKGYGYGSVKKNSIFVFDDFERLASTSEKQISGADKRKEGKEDPETLTKQMKSDEEKYLPIIGVINEMVETFDYRVIIVCNIDMLGEKFVSDVLRSKLNCLEYRKTEAYHAAYGLAQKVIRKFVMKEEVYKVIYDCIKEFNTDVVMDYLGTSNLRMFANIIEATTISALNAYGEDGPDNTEMESLFASILITKHFYDEGDIEFLFDFPIGMNLGMIEDVETQALIDELYNIKGILCRWVGIQTAGHWFLYELDVYDVLEDHVGWEEYNYSALEEKLIKGDYNIADEEFSICHICYIINRVIYTDDIEIQSFRWQRLVEVYLQHNNLNSGMDVQVALELFERYLLDTGDRHINNEIFRCICEASQCKKSAGESRFITKYNSYVDDILYPVDDEDDRRNPDDEDAYNNGMLRVFGV